MVKIGIIKLIVHQSGRKTSIFPFPLVQMRQYILTNYIVLFYSKLMNTYYKCDIYNPV